MPGKYFLLDQPPRQPVVDIVLLQGEDGPSAVEFRIPEQTTNVGAGFTSTALEWAASALLDAYAGSQTMEYRVEGRIWPPGILQERQVTRPNMKERAGTIEQHMTACNALKAQVDQYQHPGDYAVPKHQVASGVGYLLLGLYRASWPDVHRFDELVDAGLRVWHVDRTGQEGLRIARERRDKALQEAIKRDELHQRMLDISLTSPAGEELLEAITQPSTPVPELPQPLGKQAARDLLYPMLNTMLEL